MIATLRVVGTGFAALRSALLFPILMIFIGLGIWYLLSSYKDYKHKLLVIVLLVIFYCINVFNFINIYFFRNPIYNSEAYNLSSRVVSKYLSLSQENNKKVLVISNSPKTNFKHYLFETNSFNATTSSNIMKQFKNNTFEMNNVIFTQCSASLNLEDNPIIITDASQKCESIDISKTKNIAAIPLLADGGPVLKIYNDSICMKYNLDRYPHNFSFSDFAVEALDEKRFCEKFITNLK